ncbi:kelch repeat domain [Anaeramoeba flamelloides]|uniref:Kelch repeat domain n=1 Tax=Anaeramoeba flamelloides TaxID=1746091 RepID=A0ABQ8XDF6_9EUKA|nr:kelch repeat domain [Anaeramoeba flamelloides]
MLAMGGENKPPPLIGHCLVVYEDRLWVFGGHTSAKDGKNLFSDRLYVYNFKTHSWEAPFSVGNQKNKQTRRKKKKNNQNKKKNNKKKKNRRKLKINKQKKKEKNRRRKR